MLDAGSSHTAVFIYKWPADKENDTGVVSEHSMCDVEGKGCPGCGGGSPSLALPPPRAPSRSQEVLGGSHSLPKPPPFPGKMRSEHAGSFSLQTQGGSLPSPAGSELWAGSCS